jgi:hypothetical protein
MLALLATARESTSIGTGSTAPGHALPDVAPLSPGPQDAAASADYAAARPRRRPLRPNSGHHRALGEHVVEPHHLPGRMRRRNWQSLASRTAQLV